MPDDSLTTVPNATDDHLTHLLVSELVPWAGNVRSKRSSADVDAMAESIKTVGLINPLLVARKGDEWNVVAGVTRYKALSKLGWTTVPCIVLPESADDRSLAAISLAENTSRTGMPMHDIVRGLRAVLASGIEDINEAAAVLGQPIDTTKYAAQLTRLTDDALAKLEKGKIGTEFALELSKLSHDRQRNVLRRLKEFTNSYSPDNTPDHMILKREIAKDRVSADAVAFSEEEFVAAGGTVHRDLLGTITYEPFALVMQLQRDAGRKMAEKLKSKHKWVDFFESNAQNSYHRVYVHDAKNPKPEKAGAVVLLTPDARLETRTPVTRFEDVKAKEKADRQKEKEAAKADGKGGEEEVSSGINDFAAQYLADFTRHSLITAKQKVALAVVLSNHFRAWPRQANALAPASEMLEASNELKELRQELNEFEKATMAKGYDLSVTSILAMEFPDMVELLKLYAMHAIFAYKHDDKHCLAILAACGKDPGTMRMATLPVLKRLKREQLDAIAQQLGLIPAPGEPKGGLARRIELALQDAKGGWQPPGISYNG